MPHGGDSLAGHTPSSRDVEDRLTQSFRAFDSVVAIKPFSGVVAMASIVVRGFDEAVKLWLAAQAKQHGRSMEAEVRDILTEAATRRNIALAILHAGQAVGGVDQLPVPARADAARAVDFS
jgi:plasmid stability protein